MATVEIISKSRYQAEFEGCVGSLSFPKEYYNCLHHVDKKKLRKTLGDSLPKGKRILAVLIANNTHPSFKNIKNEAIHYLHPVYTDDTMDGAFLHPEGINTFAYVTNHPIGDAFVVIN
jgi:hypothetical protein